MPHFSRSFKEQIGMTPVQYHREVIDRRKAAMPMERAPIAEVVLDEITGNQMYLTAREHFPLILKISFFLAEGDISVLGSEERWRFFEDIEPRLNVHESEQACLANVQRLRAHAEQGFPVRIWRTLASADTICLFAYLCDVLRAYHCPIEVVDHPDSTCQYWGLMNDKRFEDYLPFAKPLSEEEKEHYAALWRRLQDENALLRVKENGTVRSAPADYFDDRLIHYLPTPESGVARVDDVASGPLSFGDRDQDPLWYQYRLKTFIKEGWFEYVPIEGADTLTIIRHKDAPKTITMDDLRVIGWEHLPHFPTDKAPHLPEAQVWAVLSASGRVYAVQNDDIERLLSLMAKNGDTRITKWVTLWWYHREPDLPSFAARKAILELEPANADALLLLQEYRRVCEKRLGDTM